MIDCFHQALFTRLHSVLLKHGSHFVPERSPHFLVEEKAVISQARDSYRALLLHYCDRPGMKCRKDTHCLEMSQDLYQPPQFNVSFEGRCLSKFNSRHQLQYFESCNALQRAFYFKMWL